MTDRNVGYEGLKLGEAKFVEPVCQFANYLAYFFARYLAHGCSGNHRHTNSLDQASNMV
jgi:hypothetical protein